MCVIISHIAIEFSFSTMVWKFVSVSVLKPISDAFTDLINAPMNRQTRRWILLSHIIVAATNFKLTISWPEEVKISYRKTFELLLLLIGFNWHWQWEKENDSFRRTSSLIYKRIYIIMGFAVCLMIWICLMDWTTVS